MRRRSNGGVRGRIGVVGSGVSGLVAAHVLQRRYQVTLFEADGRLGGHAHTHDVGPERARLQVDTGFMVFNSVNYPRLTRLFAELGVRTRPSEMSLAVTCDECGLRYLAGSALRELPHHAAGISERRWAGARAEVDRFNFEAENLLAAEEDYPTLGEFLGEHGFSDFFSAHVALPLVAAVWSCDTRSALDYPAHYLFRFLANHGQLRCGAATRWRTVVGGSRTYVNRVAAGLSTVRLSTPIRSAIRTATGVELLDDAGRSHAFDRVVIATHPDQALRVLGDATATEREVLGAISYISNDTVLHTDSSLLPAQPGAWNYRSSSCQPTAAATVMSYSLNRLQAIPGPTDYIVTLNASDRMRTDRVLSRMAYRHPVYNEESVRARARLPELTTSRVAFAGAYHGWGFHEDGCTSGVRAAAAFGVLW